jgi:hypothetical protein
MPMVSAALEALLAADLATAHASIFTDAAADPGQASNVSRLCNFIAKIAPTLVPYIQANAVVTVAAGIVVQVVPATGTGATTGPGTGTIS